MEREKLVDLVNELVKLPKENEWVEFKLNNCNEEMIGKYISALSNSACLHSREFGYLIFGIEDGSHEIKGTTFSAKSHKKGNESFENWLSNKLNPRIDFRIYEFDYDADRKITLFEIPSAKGYQVTFSHIPYIRVGEATRSLNEFPEKAAKIFRDDSKKFEKLIAKSNLSISNISSLLSFETYYDLMKIPFPSNIESIVNKFIEEGFIKKDRFYSITNLGAILFAKDIRHFENIEFKSPRVIVYKGKNRLDTEREQLGLKGYAVGFEGLISWINSQLPSKEEIGTALRTEITMYPPIAIRELVANALIHQNFNEKGCPMIEIFSDRVEISNPGVPLISSDRFIDSVVSRNDKLSDVMRRLGLCEKKGSGLDKVIHNIELYHLPAIEIVISDLLTKVIVFSYKNINEMSKRDKILACYQHTCLKYVSYEKMTNQTLRDRFQVDTKNMHIVSRIIGETLKAELIIEDDPSNKSRRFASYIPYWA